MPSVCRSNGQMLNVAKLARDAQERLDGASGLSQEVLQGSGRGRRGLPVPATAAARSQGERHPRWVDLTTAASVDGPATVQCHCIIADAASFSKGGRV